jgi:hypothetical protein
LIVPQPANASIATSQMTLDRCRMSAPLIYLLRNSHASTARHEVPVRTRRLAA